MPSTATDRLNGLTTSVAVKPPCRVATTANITLSGLQTINGVALAEDDRVLVKDQTTQSQNGVYLASTGDWTRAKDFDGNRDVVQGTRVLVAMPNSAHAAEYEVTTANPITIDTTSITFVLRYGANATYDRTAAEIALLVTPTNYAYPEGTADRYGTNTTPGTTDMTSAIQTAINVSAQARRPAELLGSTYLVTDTLSLPDKAQIVGTHLHQYLDGGAKIQFSPASAKSLFVPSGAPASFRYGYSIDGLHIVGNSADAAGNSIYAIDAHGWNKCLVRNVAITGFRTGVRCYATINNRFEFVQIQNCYIQNILYDGGSSTTDVWEQPYFGNAPIGVQTNGTNLGIRWVDIAIEGCTTYGFNIVKESYGFMIEGGYSEDVPTANVATNALFRVGFDGSSLAAGGAQLIVKGGFWSGRNAGAAGSCLDVDYTDGVVFEPGIVNRFTNGIKTSSNTQTNQVVSGQFVAVALGSIVTDATKIVGFYPQGTFGSGTRNNQNLATRQIAFPNSPSTPLSDYREYTSASIACTGAITTAAVWNVTKNGREVTLTLPAINGTATATPYFEFGEAMGVAFRPVETVVFPCVIRDNGATLSTPGMILVNTSGAIRVYKDLNGTTNYTNAASAGLGQSAGASVSWTV